MHQKNHILFMHCFNSILQKKTLLRKAIQKQRHHLKERFVDTALQKITQKLMTHPLLNQSLTIAGYFSHCGEVNLSLWYAYAWEQEKKCYLPVILNTQLSFHHYHAGTILKKNRWGIQEPYAESSPHIPIDELDVVLIPMLAFDERGFRLGYGQGYYDRSFSFLLKKTFTQKKPYLIGLGYDFQKVDTLPHNPWDIPLQEVITETAHYRYDSS